MPKQLQKEFYLSAKILELLLFMAKKVSRYGQDTKTKRLFRVVYSNTFTQESFALFSKCPTYYVRRSEHQMQSSCTDWYRSNRRCRIQIRNGGEKVEALQIRPTSIQWLRLLFQNEGTLIPFLVEKMKTLGTAACPPYHICFVIGGTSAEKNLLTVKLGSIKYYDALPTTGDETGRAFRDIELEKKLLEEAHKNWTRCTVWWQVSCTRYSYHSPATSWCQRSYRYGCILLCRSQYKGQNQ